MNYPMLDILNEGVVALGQDRQIYYCNDAFVKIFDLPAARSITGRSIYDYVMFSDTNFFVMPDGNKGENDILHFELAQFETYRGLKGEIDIAIVPTREVFAKNKLWFAYFAKKNPLNLVDDSIKILNEIMSSSDNNTLPENLVQKLRIIKSKLILI